MDSTGPEQVTVGGLLQQLRNWNQNENFSGSSATFKDPKVETEEARSYRLERARTRAARIRREMTEEQLAEFRKKSAEKQRERRNKLRFFTKVLESPHRESLPPETISMALCSMKQIKLPKTETPEAKNLRLEKARQRAARLRKAINEQQLTEFRKKCAEKQRERRLRLMRGQSGTSDTSDKSGGASCSTPPDEIEAPPISAEATPTVSVPPSFLEPKEIVNGGVLADGPSITLGQLFNLPGHKVPRPRIVVDKEERARQAKLRREWRTRERIRKDAEMLFHHQTRDIAAQLQSLLPEFLLMSQANISLH